MQKVIIQCHSSAEYYLWSNTFVLARNERRDPWGSKVMFQVFLVVFVSMPPLQFLHRSGMNVSKVWRNPAGQAVRRVIQSSHTQTHTRTHTHTHTHTIHSCLCAWLYIHPRKRGRTKSAVYLPSYRIPGDQFRSYVLINKPTKHLAN
jgi:hypothetical protein